MVFLNKMKFTAVVFASVTVQSFERCFNASISLDFTEIRYCRTEAIKLNRENKTRSSFCSGEGEDDINLRLAF